MRLFVSLLCVLLFQYATALSVVTVQPMQFPAQQNLNQYRVVLSPEDNGGGDFYALGLAGQKAMGHVLPSSILLQQLNGSNRIRLVNITYGGAMSPNGEFYFPASGPGIVRQDNLRVGGTLVLGPNVSPGWYRGQAVFRMQMGGVKAYTNFYVMVRVLTTLRLTTVQGMTFLPQETGLNQTVTLLPTDPGSARFNAVGEAGELAALTVHPNEVPLLNPRDAHAKIRVFNFRFGWTHGAINPVSGVFRFPGSVGQALASDILLGASAEYKADLPAGRYQGMATVSIIYQ